MEEKKITGTEESAAPQEEKKNVMENGTMDGVENEKGNATGQEEEKACPKGTGSCRKMLACFVRRYYKAIGVLAFVLIVAAALMLLLRVAVDVRESVGNLWDRADESDYDEIRISDQLTYCDYEEYENKGYVCDKKGRKVLKHILWINKALGNASETAPVCYNDGRLCGYFHPVTGKVIVKPVWDDAWAFSEGLAAVYGCDGFKFIDTAGRIVIEGPFGNPREMFEAYDDISRFCFFTNGHCAAVAVDSSETRMGIMDRNGQWAFPPVYNDINRTDSFWILRTEADEWTIVSLDMDTILTVNASDISIDDCGFIKAIMPDHTVRAYSMQGELLEESLVCNVEQLFYHTRGMQYKTENEWVEDEYGDGDYETVVAADSKQAVATCFRYEAQQGQYGLMSPDGRPVTLPLYNEIEAIDKDLYLCKITDEYPSVGVLLDSKGRKDR